MPSCRLLLSLLFSAAFYMPFSVAQAAEEVAAATEESEAPLRIILRPEKRALTSANVQAAEEALAAIPGGTDVVPATEFLDTRAVTVKDMLDFTPGVFAQSRTAEESRLSIRGSGLSRTFHLRGISLLQDGIPVNNADGAADFQDIDPLAFSHVEVYKGSNGLRYGAASLGGAVNFVTPTGYDTEEKLRLEYGSFETRRVGVSSGKVIGDSDYFASLSNLQSDGFRAQSETDNSRFSGNVGHRINDNLETRVYLQLGQINQELSGGITKAQLNTDPKQANPANAGNSYQRDFQVMRLANKTTWKQGDREINGGAYVKYKDLYHPIFQLVDQVSKEVGVFADTTKDGMLGGRANSYTLGGRISVGNTDADRFLHTNGVQGAIQASAMEKARNLELYGENRWDATAAVTLIGGAQVIHAIRDYSDKMGTRSGEKDYTGISPKIGALWQANPAIQVFGNVSRGYEPPTFSELTGMVPGIVGLMDIDAQKSTTVEIGSRGHWRSMRWDASVYRSWLKDELMNYAIGMGGASVTVNADDTVHQGLELGAEFDLWRRLFTQADEGDDVLSWRTAYSYNDFRFDGDATYGDNDIPGAPDHYIRSELRYAHPTGWFIAPQLEWVPNGYAIDMANTYYSDGYATYGLNAGYKINARLSLYVDARNLTDEKYAATTGVVPNASGTDQPQFYPGDGRAVYAGIRANW